MEQSPTLAVTDYGKINILLEVLTGKKLEILGTIFLQFFDDVLDSLAFFLFFLLTTKQFRLKVSPSKQYKIWRSSSPKPVSRDAQAFT